MRNKPLPRSDHLMRREPLSRRDFLKLGGISAGSLLLGPQHLPSRQALQNFPDAPHLARAVGDLNVRSLPDINSALVGVIKEDDVLPWIREVVGEFPGASVRRWVETPVGWVWSPNLQPVKNLPAKPVTELIQTSIGPGMWVQVCVPYVEVSLEYGQPLAPWLEYRIYQEHKPTYLYYDQVFWVDDIRTDINGQAWYRLSELYGSYGDVFIGPAEAFRKIEPEEIAPISPEAEEKTVEVNLRRQTVQAFEGSREVFFARCSTGLDGEETETPLGLYHQVWRKSISTHMAGNTAQGYDTPGIGYTTLFVGSGVAFHATFWHNAYGAKRSHGCVNLRPDDAKWIWRWTTPYVAYDPGDKTVTDYSGTVVRVVDY